MDPVQWIAKTFSQHFNIIVIAPQLPSQKGFTHQFLVSVLILSEGLLGLLLSILFAAMTRNL